MKRKKQSGGRCMPYFGTVSSLLQSVDKSRFMRKLDCRLVEVRARLNLVTLSALCRPHQCVGVENDSEA